MDCDRAVNWALVCGLYSAFHCAPAMVLACTHGPPVMSCLCSKGLCCGALYAHLGWPCRREGAKCAFSAYWHSCTPFAQGNLYSTQPLAKKVETLNGWLMDCCVATQVDASVSKVYRIWANRINYNEWFDLIGQVCTLRPLLSCHLASLSFMGSPSFRNTASDGC